MDQAQFDKLKGQIGEQAAIRYERSHDAGVRVMQGKGRPLDLVSVFADGLLYEADMAGHFISEAALAVGGAAVRAGEAVATEYQHVTGHDKPLDTPKAPPAASAKEPEGKGK